MFGHTMPRLACVYAMASVAIMPVEAIKYAQTTVALRLMP